jgi:hypothetical protein
MGRFGTVRMNQATLGPAAREVLQRRLKIVPNGALFDRHSAVLFGDVVYGGSGAVSRVASGASLEHTRPLAPE